MLIIIFALSLLVSVCVVITEFLLVEQVTGIKIVLEFVSRLCNGIIVSSIFYYIVNYLPFQSKKKRFECLLDLKMKEICECFRQCKESCRIYDFNTIGIEQQESSDSSKDKTKEREEYLSIFASKDYSYFNETKECTDKVSIKDFLVEKRSKIRTLAEALLPYSDMLTDSQFEIVSAVLNSEFLINGLLVPFEESSFCNDNRRAVGAEFFDFYERFVQESAKKCSKN